jgi:hypothetical protein
MLSRDETRMNGRLHPWPRRHFLNMLSIEQTRASQRISNVIIDVLTSGSSSLESTSRNGREVSVTR